MDGLEIVAATVEVREQPLEVRLAAGTLIPRFAQNAHTTGTAAAELGSFMLMTDVV